jgi:hypothetical protein
VVKQLGSRGGVKKWLPLDAHFYSDDLGKCNVIEVDLVALPLLIKARVLVWTFTSCLVCVIVIGHLVC